MLQCEKAFGLADGCFWQQFNKTGPVSSFFSSLNSAIVAESIGDVSIRLMRFDLESCGTVVKFENLWNYRVFEEINSNFKVDGEVSLNMCN